MSCEECTWAQLEMLRLFHPVPEYYVRIGEGNVQLIGCRQHIGEATLFIRAGMRPAVPEDAVWFEPEVFQQILNDFLENYEGVKYSKRLMDAAHGDWVKRSSK